MLIKKVKHDNVIWGIWKIEEDIDTLLSSLHNTGYKDSISSEKRLLEQTAVRVLLKTLIDQEKTIAYSSNGKPYLEDGSFNISISHTKGYAAVILSESSLVGIDIEYISDKVKRVRSRFISDSEYIDADNETIHLLLHWSAKESMYKAIGSMGVDFTEHLHIDKFTPARSGNFSAYEKHTNDSLKFNIQYFVEDNYVLTLIY